MVVVAVVGGGGGWWWWWRLVVVVAVGGGGGVWWLACEHAREILREWIARVTHGLGCSGLHYSGDGVVW
jgi:hypothetical protein